MHRAQKRCFIGIQGCSTWNMLPIVSLYPIKLWLFGVAALFLVYLSAKTTIYRPGSHSSEPLVRTNENHTSCPGLPTSGWGGVIGVSVLRYHPPKVIDKTIISQKTLKQDWLNPMFHVEHHPITGPDIQKPSTLKKILGQQPVFQRPHQGLVFFLLILIAQQMKQTVENNTVQLSVKRLTQV